MIVETAPAKLNLALHVRRRRDDGYHELETLFAFVVDGDTVTISPADRDAFSITGPFAGGLITDTDNLVIRARNAFRQTFGVTDPVAIVLDKRLPIASGIGGGSADAAATLRAMARMFTADPADDRLTTIAAALGSDVPACLFGRTMVGRGRGEQLRGIAGLPPMAALLVNPGIALSTAAVFAAWDRVDRGPLPTGEAWAIAIDGRNDLEPAARTVVPAIDLVLGRLSRFGGVRLVRMSGSGATCFALFDSVADRAAAAAIIKAEHPGWWCLETELS